MITFQKETFKEMFGDTFVQLIKESWNETGMFHKSFPLNPRWDMYKFLDENDTLFVYTARRSDDNLIGYFIAVIVEHNYYQDIWVAETDAFYLHPKYRSGLTGYKFLKHTINELKERVSMIFLPVNIQRDLSKLLNRLGFNLVEYKFALEV